MTDLIESNIKSKVKLIDSTIFDSFKTLTSDVETDRFNGSLQLLQHLNKPNFDSEKQSKERDYTLIRLIRGLGASTFASRAGFFTTLVGFLSLPSNQTLGLDGIFEILKKQLHVGKGQGDKEDSDALIGHILFCGALLRSNKLFINKSSAAATTTQNKDEPNKHIIECVQILIRSSNHKSFHASMAYQFIIELVNRLDEKQFRACMWPLLRKELHRPWERHTCNTIQCLLILSVKYSNLLDEDFLQSSIKTREILTPLAYKHFGRIFWGNTSLTTITHPAFDALSTFLLTVKRKQLLAFWQSEINELLAAPTKIKEVLTLKLLTDFMNGGGAAGSGVNSATGSGSPATTEKIIIDSKTFLKLLTPRFIKMIVQSIKLLKQQKHDVLKTFYEEFFTALREYFKFITNNEEKVAIIHKFILPSDGGLLLLEKYLPQNVIHQLIAHLEHDGVCLLFKTYKSIFMGQLEKNTTTDNKTSWLNIERHHAAQMMQYLLGQKCVQQDLDWRTEQLRFLLSVSLFHTSADGTIVVRKEQDSCGLTRDLCQSIKLIFYSSLQMKLSNIKDEKRILLVLTQDVNDILTKKNPIKYLRDPVTEKAIKSWEQMYNQVHSADSNGTISQSEKHKKKSDKKLQLTFHILFLHMGLQLFRETDMAQVAIADLIKCFEKTVQIKKINKMQKLDGAVGDEPEWIEVVVDLFLHLLSQNTSFLRNIVANIFPHLCPNLTLNAVHHILTMLDMKDNKNPLSDGLVEEMQNDDDDDDNDGENDDRKSVDGSEDDEDDSVAEEGGDDDDDEENEDVTEEEEGTVSDQLRNAISTALGSFNGANIKTKNITNNDEIDLNDLDDEEGERLDRALSTAFQYLKKSNGSTNSRKKSKKTRTTNTIVMHFRIRVLDLIEIYLKTKPILSITLEIMISLFTMLDHCSDADLKPLSDKILGVLKRLLELRQFDNVADVSVGNIIDLMKTLIVKKVDPTKLTVYNVLLGKSFNFLITNSQLLQKTQPELTNFNKNNPILCLIMEYAEEFIKSRNPKISFSLLLEIFKLRWIGVWNIGKLFGEYGLKNFQQTRPFRRIQLMELLTIMYKNHGFISGTNTDKFNPLNKQLERTIEDYIDQVYRTSLSESIDGTTTNTTTPQKISSKEFSALLVLLTEMFKCHKIPTIKSTIQWTNIIEKIQLIRQQILLVSMQVYTTFCRCLGVQVVKKVINKPKQQNKKNELNGLKNVANETNDIDDDDEDMKTATNGKQTLKRKATKPLMVENKKEKKMKKEERLRIASEGLNGVSFTGVSDEEDNDEEDQDNNEDQQEENDSSGTNDDDDDDDDDENSSDEEISETTDASMDEDDDNQDSDDADTGRSSDD